MAIMPAAEWFGSMATRSSGNPMRSPRRNVPAAPDRESAFRWAASDGCEAGFSAQRVAVAPQSPAQRNLRPIAEIPFGVLEREACRPDVGIVRAGEAYRGSRRLLSQGGDELLHGKTSASRDVVNQARQGA